MSERYGFSLTTFSPSGKLVQIEYALNAVNAGSPAVGIKASNGVVLATEKKSKSDSENGSPSALKVRKQVDSIADIAELNSKNERRVRFAEASNGIHFTR